MKFPIDLFSWVAGKEFQRRYLWCLGFLLVGMLNLPAENATLNPRRLDEVVRLVIRPENDTNDPRYIETPKDYALRMAAIRDARDITPYLFKLLDICYFNARERGWDFQDVLRAIALRHDLTPEQVEMITGEIRDVVKNKPGENTMRYKYRFAISGIQILGNYPSTEREDLAMALLQYEGKDRDWFEMRCNAAKSLGKMGTLRAAPVIRALAERLKTVVYPGDPYEGPELAALASLPDKIEAQAKSKSSHNVGR